MTEDKTAFKPLISFLLFGLFLGIQFLFSIKYEEPYPCIRLPGFGSIPDVDSKVEIEDFDLHVYYSDGQVEQVEHQEAFRNIPWWFIPGTMNHLLKKEISSKELQQVEDFGAWLESQLSAEPDFNTIKKLEIRSYKSVFDMNAGTLSDKTVLSEKVFKFALQ